MLTRERNSDHLSDLVMITSCRGCISRPFFFFFFLKFRVWGMEYVMQAVCNKVAFCHTTSTYTKQLFKCEESHMSVWGGCISHLNTHRVR